MRERRDLLRTVGGLTLGGTLAGCLSDSGGGETVTRGEHEVLAGPDNQLVFRPETLTVPAGTTVTWRFVSPNHNVCCVPDHHRDVELPDGADPFASYEGDDLAATRPVGDTFAHTFETPGRYVYVCIPHAANGMVGTIQVED
jgi:plastocyanin